MNGLSDTELFRTPSGSHLYGLNHFGSDLDIFVVTDSDRDGARQRIDQHADWTFRGLNTFLTQVAAGSHQSCEAAFSAVKEFTAAGERYRPLIDGLRVSSPDAFAKYERTITAFCFGDFKRRRHAVRLTSNLADLRRYGRFEPRLSAAQIAECNTLATELCDAALVTALLPGVTVTAAEHSRHLTVATSRLGRA